MEHWDPIYIGVIVGVVVFLLVLFTDFFEFAMGLLFIGLLVFWISFNNDPAYYQQCTTDGKSYVRCFYDRVVKW